MQKSVSMWQAPWARNDTPSYSPGSADHSPLKKSSQSLRVAFVDQCDCSGGSTALPLRAAERYWATGDNSEDWNQDQEAGNDNPAEGTRPRWVGEIYTSPCKVE